MSGDSAEEVVYVPRQFANPADASQIVRRRSCSSESSVDPNPDDKKKTKKRKEGSSLAITISSHQAALHDHGYMAARQQGADSDISRASGNHILIGLIFSTDFLCSRFRITWSVW